MEVTPASIIASGYRYNAIAGFGLSREDQYLNQIVHQAQGDVFDEDMTHLLMAGKRIYIQPFEFSQEAQLGRWNQRPFLDSIAHQQFSLVITREMITPILSSSRYTPQMVKAFSRYYCLGHRLPDYYVYTPCHLMPEAVIERLATTTLRYARARHITEIIVPGHTWDFQVLTHRLAGVVPHTVHIDDTQTVLLPDRPALCIAVGHGFTQDYLARMFPNALVAQETLSGTAIHVAWYLLTPRDRSHALTAGTRLDWTASWRGHNLLHLERVSLPTRLHPGEDVAGVVAMTVEHQTTLPYSIYLHLIDQTGRPVARQDQAMPEGGMLMPGDVVVERFDLYVAQVGRPSLITAHLGAYVAPAGTGTPLAYLQWHSARGGAAVRTVPLAQLVAPPPPPLPPTHPVRVVFGEGIILIGYDLQQHGRQLEVTLHWLATRRLGKDCTAFVHVLDPAEKLIAQNDSPPVAGAFPTAFWQAGDVVLDRHAMKLPVGLSPGTYRLEVGLYDPTTIRRLSVIAGHPLLRVQLSGTQRQGFISSSFFQDLFGGSSAGNSQ
ncbi:MAG: hypothetical protein M1118_11080 [Chloroflexi bacterium]|nr:hypothetical protein [Chloroflexota bacterium]